MNIPWRIYWLWGAVGTLGASFGGMPEYTFGVAVGIATMGAMSWLRGKILERIEDE